MGGARVGADNEGGTRSLWASLLPSVGVVRGLMVRVRHGHWGASLRRRCCLHRCLWCSILSHPNTFPHTRTHSLTPEPHAALRRAVQVKPRCGCPHRGFPHTLTPGPHAAQVKPPVGLSTPQIFKSLDLGRRSAAEPRELLAKLASTPEMPQELAVNDLEQPAFDK
eukprot:360905-Chlamydomonas_euryale.AAC.1